MSATARKSDPAGTSPAAHVLVVVIGLLVAILPWPVQAEGGSVERGAYLFRAAGCGGCHTDVKAKGAPLAGGRALPTPFGTFYGPNITPDPDHGLGLWTKDDFRRALRAGVSPEGEPYYPAFPYTSFSKMADGDIDDLWHYLQTVPAVARPDRAHELRFPFNLRPLMQPWRWLFFRPGSFQQNAERDESWNRGAYLVDAVGHCGECHSPRGLLGQVDAARALGGNPQGPENEKVPNITPHREQGIGRWSADDIVTYLSLGMRPDGDFAGSAMAEVVETSTGNLSEKDLEAIAYYLRSRAPYPAQPTQTASTSAAAKDIGAAERARLVFLTGEDRWE